VDNENPHPSKKPRRKPSFDEVMASANTPHTGPHRTCPARPKQAAATKMRRATKRAKAHAAAGHVPAASMVHMHVQPAIPLATSFNASALLTMLCAYAGKVEDRAEKR
jgi:hypothetical protein